MACITAILIPTTVVIPAKAGIQYSRAFAAERRRSGILGRPVEPGDDGGGWGRRGALLRRCEAILIPLAAASGSRFRRRQ
ncbi:hypothetical protein DU475_18965 [Rhodopseudomonas sp. WA056]|nr:hypothetical protein [Rhodopseudomonas sp. WA056]